MLLLIMIFVNDGIWFNQNNRLFVQFDVLEMQDNLKDNKSSSMSLYWGSYHKRDQCIFT